MKNERIRVNEEKVKEILWWKENIYFIYDKILQIKTFLHFCQRNIYFSSWLK